MVRARDGTRARPALHVGATRYSSAVVRRCRWRACLAGARDRAAAVPSARARRSARHRRTTRVTTTCSPSSTVGFRRSRPRASTHLDGRHDTGTSMDAPASMPMRRTPTVASSHVRRLARLLLIVGIAAAVFGLSKYHAQFIGEYDFTESFRFAWAIAYCGILLVVCYGLGLPDLPRTLASGFLTSHRCCRCRRVGHLQRATRGRRRSAAAFRRVRSGAAGRAVGNAVRRVVVDRPRGLGGSRSCRRGRRRSISSASWRPSSECGRSGRR